MDWMTAEEYGNMVVGSTDAALLGRPAGGRYAPENEIIESAVSGFMKYAEHVMRSEGGLGLPEGVEAVARKHIREYLEYQKAKISEIDEMQERIEYMQADIEGVYRDIKEYRSPNTSYEDFQSCFSD